MELLQRIKGLFMTDEIYSETNEEETQSPKEAVERQPVVHVNKRTKPLFEKMLNSVGKNIKVGKTQLGYGTALHVLDEEQFNCFFDIWISKCLEKNIMRKTLSRDSDKVVEWSNELDDVEKAHHGLEALREIL